MKKIQPPQKMNAISSSAEKRRLKHFTNSNLALHNSLSFFYIIRFLLFLFNFLNFFRQITKKRFSTALSSVSEDSSNFAPISNISYHNNNDDVTTLLFEEVSSEESEISSALNDWFGAYELDNAIFTSMNDALVAENSLVKVDDSIIADPRYRKLLDEITKHVMEELCRSIQPEESKCVVDHVLHAKNQMLFPCLCIWIIVVLALFFFTSDNYCSPSGQLPT